MTAKEVADLRERFGFTRQSFARFLGCNLRTVARWETGENPPTGICLEVLKGLSAIDARVPRISASTLADLITYCT